jgi:hypothetical protein
MSTTRGYSKKSIILLSVAMAAAACGHVAAVPTRPVAAAVPSKPAVASAAMARLQTIARSLARLNGDSHPVRVTAVATTARAVYLPGEMPGPGTAAEAVYLISMYGNFKGYGFSRPPGAPLPTGKVFEIVVNAKTFRVMSIALPYHSLNVRALGKPFSLAWK